MAEAEVLAFLSLQAPKARRRKAYFGEWRRCRLNRLLSPIPISSCNVKKTGRTEDQCAQFPGHGRSQNRLLGESGQVLGLPVAGAVSEIRWLVSNEGSTNL